MIAGIFHKGSGLGDQLFRYITARTLALDKGYDFGMVNLENFKGKDFMKLDMGKTVLENSMVGFNEKKVLLGDLDITQYDPEINFVGDNAIIDGNFEDIKYWGHRLNEIREWLKVEPLEMPDDLCVINFRGGEYKVFPDLFLTAEYWQAGIGELLRKYGRIKFEIHTDDIEEAEKFKRIVNINPDIKVVRDIGLNWRSIRYAKHLILSNSAFGILPALLNENVKEVIVPRYWARRNIGIWARPSCYYPKFTYI